VRCCRVARVDVWGAQLRINPTYPVKEQDDLAGLGADIGDHLLDHRAEDPFLPLRPRRRRPAASTRASVLHGRSALPTGCASPGSRASSESREMLAFAHIPKGAAINKEIDVGASKS
jgi:hypothetical protein